VVLGCSRERLVFLALLGFAAAAAGTRSVASNTADGGCEFGVFARMTSVTPDANRPDFIAPVMMFMGRSTVVPSGHEDVLWDEATN
jgi:hypothetical protein